VPTIDDEAIATRLAEVRARIARAAAAAGRDPASVGLVAVTQPWDTCWQAPGSNPLFATPTQETAA
jgi:hypothetical protein